MKKKVSVHIITYNHVNFIKNCLDSVITQKTSFSYEIIVGDDCSTDGTREILIEYKKKYPDLVTLILFEKHNEGLPGKVNFMTVFNNCTGEYVALCEGDDYWCDENKLQKQVDFLETNRDFSISFHKAIEVDAAGRVIKKFNLDATQKDITTIDDLSKGNYICTASSVFRNGLVKQFPKWFLKSQAGDYPLFLFLSQYGKLSFINQSMAAYRVHAGGFFSNKKSIEVAKGNSYMLRNLIFFFRNNIQVRSNLTVQLTAQLQILLKDAYKKKQFLKLVNRIFTYIFFSTLFLKRDILKTQSKWLYHHSIKLIKVGK